MPQKRLSLSMSKFVITTECCEKANSGALLLCYVGDVFGANGEKPIWMACTKRSHLVSCEPCSFCPFCGSPVPELEPRKTGNLKIASGRPGIYYMDYCGTCNERHMCCECAPPEWKWKVKPKGVL